MNRIRKTICKTLGVLLILCSVWSATTHANMVSYTFEAVVSDGMFAGQSGIGSFTFDDSNLFDSGFTTLGFAGSTFVDFNDLTTFSFSFLGQSFSGANDAGFPDTPTVDFFDGQADFLDFFVQDGGGNAINNPFIVSLNVVGLLLAHSDPNIDFVVELFVETRVLNLVSTPYLSPLMFTLLMAYILFFKRKASRKVRFA